MDNSHQPGACCHTPPEAGSAHLCWPHIPVRPGAAVPGCYHCPNQVSHLLEEPFQGLLPQLTPPSPAAVTRMSASKLVQGPNPSNSCIDSPVSDPPWGPSVGVSAVTFLWPSTFPRRRQQETAAGFLPVYKVR